MSRLRLIADPNGSGKSSIFQLIKEFKEKQKVIPTGPFINSDLIEKEFKDKGYIELRLFGIESPPASLISDYLKISTFKEPYDAKVIVDLVVLEGGYLKLKGGEVFTTNWNDCVGFDKRISFVKRYIIYNGDSFLSSRQA